MIEALHNTCCCSFLFYIIWHHINKYFKDKDSSSQSYSTKSYFKKTVSFTALSRMKHMIMFKCYGVIEN
ncbi:unnamed protein product [Chironomus riparius]|uniref:Uncharacterized protein n=1 Tax=Chironomus riparius TaxID=315576 RepID=A0A9N9WQ02_9DIPT|nr:unnamed protein product [Chironomus riparius]